MRRMRAAMWLAWIFSAAVYAWSIYHAAGVARSLWPSGRPLQIAAETLGALLPAVFVSVAMLIFLRQPRNVIGWILLVVTVLGISEMSIGAYLANVAPVSGQPPAHVLWMAWFTGFNWLNVILLLVLINLLFPTGRPLTPRWRWLIALAGFLWLTFVILATGSPELQAGPVYGAVPNPARFLPVALVEALIPPWQALLAVLVMVSLASLILRYWRSRSVERQQMKWLLFACAIFGLVYAPMLLLQSGAVPQLVVELFEMLFFLGIAAIPLAIGMAIARYRLFDIDLIIRQALVYALLTGLLGLVFAGMVAVTQGLFLAVTGQASEAAVVITTLTIAALFNPLRARLQAAIDRRFYRQKYDAEQAVSAFAAAARSESDLDALLAQVEDVVQRTLQPSHLTLAIKRMDAPAAPPDELYPPEANATTARAAEAAASASSSGSR